METTLESLENEFASLGARRTCLVRSLALLTQSEQALPATASDRVRDAYQFALDAVWVDINETDRAYDMASTLYRRIKKSDG